VASIDQVPLRTRLRYSEVWTLWVAVALAGFALGDTPLLVQSVYLAAVPLMLRFGGRRLNHRRLRRAAAQGVRTVYRPTTRAARVHRVIYTATLAVAVVAVLALSAPVALIGTGAACGAMLGQVTARMLPRSWWQAVPIERLLA